MLRKLNLLLLSVLMTVSYGFSQTGMGTIKGSVMDGQTKEPLYKSRITLRQNGTLKGGVDTDFDGKFQINSLTPGSYDVEVKNEGEGYRSSLIKAVIVSANQITFLDDLKLEKLVSELDEVIVSTFRIPLINKDGGASGQTITRDDIAKLPVRSAAGVAGTVGGVNAQEGSGDISVRGSRSDGTYFYIDGIKVRGSSNLPKSAI